MNRTPASRFERFGIAVMALTMACVVAWVWSLAGPLGALLVSPLLLLVLAPAIGVASALLAALAEAVSWLFAVIRRRRARAA